jgi:hypothetical protein
MVLRQLANTISITILIKPLSSNLLEPRAIYEYHSYIELWSYLPIPSEKHYDTVRLRPHYRQEVNHEEDNQFLQTNPYCKYSILTIIERI